MRKVAVALGALGVFSQICAKDIAYDDVPKSKIILEAKYLYQKYTMLENKKKAWQKRELALIEDFEKRAYGKEHFGVNNRYGKQRLAKRTYAFYHSLQEESDALQKRLSTIRQKLSAVKNRFAYLYARELTLAEMEGKRAPKIADKTEKIRLLKAYIASLKSWKNCLKKNEIFDKERMRIENSAYNNEKKYDYLNAHLDEKVTYNEIAKERYNEKVKEITEAYRALTGNSIEDMYSARIILKHIQAGD